jgi:hypothetical protein
MTLKNVGLTEQNTERDFLEYWKGSSHSYLKGRWAIQIRIYFSYLYWDKILAYGWLSY